MLPTVDFCGCTVTRLILGANPFGGFSHQTQQRNEEMLEYYTKERILETWERAEAAGINTMITNNETPHVIEAVEEYIAARGSLQWIAQVACGNEPNKMFECIDEVVKIGCCALYFHGGGVDECYRNKDEEAIRSWCDHARSAGIPVGVAGHAPEAHLWVHGLDIVDFHTVCFFNCGSLHDGKGDKFRLSDIPRAIECIRRIRKPCIGYKIMGSGRIDPRMAFEHAFFGIKPTDVVNVGMHRGDKDDMVEENAAMVREILSGA
ncbi:MAG: hypothetical protein HQ592_00690 [Planctomycetes bacterium]|nr:hypothetical protein [Planctomycetota bacterium]